MIILEQLFLWFLFYSFCGWVYESILVSVQEHRPVNRGFLNGPLCPIYGTGAVLAIVLLGSVRNPALVFVISAVGACILEYVTSWAMEKMFHARWWDYSNFRFNLNGRICLIGALVFGIGGVAIVNVIQPQVANATAMIPMQMLHWLSVAFAVLAAIDTVVTVAGVVNLEDSLGQLKATVSRYGDAMRERIGAVGDAVSDASGKVGETWQSGRDMSMELMLKVRDAAGSMLNRQQRRMIASFPKLRTEHNNEMLQQLRDTFEKLYRGR